MAMTQARHQRVPSFRPRRPARHGNRTPSLLLKLGFVALETLRFVHRSGVQLQLDPTARLAIAASAVIVQRAAGGQKPVCGLDTGLRRLANQRLKVADPALLQSSLIRSHSVSEPLPGVVCQAE
jgi:histidine ammonia-lyase